MLLLLLLVLLNSANNHNHLIIHLVGSRRHACHHQQSTGTITQTQRQYNSTTLRLLMIIETVRKQCYILQDTVTWRSL